MEALVSWSFNNTPDERELNLKTLNSGSFSWNNEKPLLKFILTASTNHRLWQQIIIMSKTQVLGFIPLPSAFSMPAPSPKRSFTASKLPLEAAMKCGASLCFRLLGEFRLFFWMCDFDSFATSWRTRNKSRPWNLETNPELFHIPLMLHWSPFQNTTTLSSTLNGEGLHVQHFL